MQKISMRGLDWLVLGGAGLLVYQTFKSKDAGVQTTNPLGSILSSIIPAGASAAVSEASDVAGSIIQAENSVSSGITNGINDVITAGENIISSASNAPNLLLEEADPFGILAGLNNFYGPLADALQPAVTTTPAPVPLLGPLGGDLSYALEQTLKMAPAQATIQPLLTATPTQSLSKFSIQTYGTQNKTRLLYGNSIISSGAGQTVASIKNALHTVFNNLHISDTSPTASLSSWEQDPTVLRYEGMYS